MKKDYTRAYTNIVAIATGMQAYLITMNLSSITNGIATAVLLTTVSIFTILKQRSSIEIDNNAVLVTWGLIVVAFFGGLNQIIQLVPINHIWQDRLKMLITGLIFMLNLVSKTLFPTQEGSIIQETKASLKDISKFK